MAHSSELRWAEAAARVAGASEMMIGILADAERVYQELLEAYNYAGGTDQDFGDLLFLDTYPQRLQDGTQATITVDVAAGVVSNPIVTEAGSGYTNGVGFTVTLTTTSGGGDGLAELTYDVVDGAITNVAVSAGGSTYDNGTAVSVTDLAAPANQVPETQANTAEVAQVTDLRLAIQALHELHQTADNVVTAQGDRYAAMRRMS